ncbi:MAG: arginine--tRNA ligase, partial [Candidatus Buchananbacteria bacterium]
RELWQTMNDWVYEGFNRTYQRQGAKFEKVYLESDTYAQGRDIVFDHLAQGRLCRDATGNIVIDLTDQGLGQKVLVRADGTTVYITQDIGTAVQRFKEFAPLGQLVYVVANEQRYHFQVLFKMLEQFGYPWAGKCFHRAYGMVNLPTGKMSSRKLKQGGVFLADELMDQLHELAKAAIAERDKELSGAELEERAEIIGLAALKYWLLRTNPDNDVTFLPEESLRFDGNSGPYLLYCIARIHSLLQKAGEITPGNLSLLASPEELALTKALAAFPETVESAATGYNPSLVANLLYEIASSFSRWYGACPILGSENQALRNARLQLAQATAIVLESGLKLLGIESLRQM